MLKTIYSTVFTPNPLIELLFYCISIRFKITCYTMYVCAKNCKLVNRQK